MKRKHRKQIVKKTSNQLYFIRKYYYAADGLYDFLKNYEPPQWSSYPPVPVRQFPPTT